MGARESLASTLIGVAREMVFRKDLWLLREFVKVLGKFEKMLNIIRVLELF